MDTDSDRKEIVKLDEKYFKDNAKVGIEDVDQDDLPIPTLSIVQATTKLRDKDGRPYAPGLFYYKGTNETFDKIECSFLVFTKKDLPSFMDKNKLVRNHIYLGVLHRNLELFRMYFQSTSIPVSKNFLAEVTTRKVPMFALNLLLTAQKASSAENEWYKPKITVIGVAAEPEKVLMLEDLTKTYEHQFKTSAEEEEEVIPAEAKPAPANGVAQQAVQDAALF